MVENSCFALTHANQQCWDTISNSPAAQWASKEKNRGINQLGRISYDQFKYKTTEHQKEAWLHSLGSNYILIKYEENSLCNSWHVLHHLYVSVWMWIPMNAPIAVYPKFSFVQQVLIKACQKQRACLNITLSERFTQHHIWYLPW